MLRCTACKQDKPDSEFGPEKRKRNGHKSQCRDCCNQASKKQYQASRTRRLADDRARRLRRYGLDESGLIDLYEQQLGECGGCSRRMPIEDLKIDHCHQHDRVRGLLCHNCNVALGLVKDNPRTLENLAAYLREQT